MELVLNFLCVAVLVLFWFGHRKHALFSAGSAVICYALALALAIVISAPLGNVVDKQLVSPPIQAQAASDIADMYSVEHKDSPADTLKQVPMKELLVDKPTSFAALADRYQQMPKTLWNAYQKGGEQAFLDTLTGGLSYAISRSVVFVVMFVLLAVLFRLISKRIESNLPLASKQQRWKQPLSMLLGLLVGFIMVEAAALILSWLVPYGAGAVLFLDNEAWQRSWLYQFSPLLWWV